MFILWFLVVLFGIMSIVFLLGKGGFLIAGYNTASAKEKAQYDEKKLNQVFGIGSATIALLLLLSIFFEDAALKILPVGIVLVVIALLIASNTICKNKEVTASSTSKPKSKTSAIASIVITTIVCAAVLIMLFTGDITIKVKDQSLIADASFTSSTTVEFQDIEEIDYVSDIPLGKRTNGVGSAKLQAGHFRNDLYGDYMLYSYADCHDYIVLKTKQGFVVINAKNTQDTKQLYSNLQNELSK
ncbi:MAG: DUF3784 domain-containing protein [Beduini sp.]|uniref:DUF3784 domain-containing protein n=1 Tax=Beduini sp. TaxID=1922300 RepID=UPI0011C8AED2